MEFESNAGPPPASHSWVDKLDAITDKIQVCKDDLHEVISAGNLMIITSSVDENWELLCKSLVFLFFNALKNPSFKQNVLDLFAVFRKCFYLTDGVPISKTQKTASYACSLLLYYHFCPEQFENCDFAFIDCTNPPPACVDPMYSLSYPNLNNILLRSLQFLNCPVAIKYSHSPLECFFDGLNLYKSKSYKESIKVLSGIIISKCSSSLVAWINLISGLCLYHLRSLDSALRQFQIAINRSPGCLYSLFYIARTYLNNGKGTAAMEVFRVLSHVDSSICEQDQSVHGVFINFHQEYAKQLPIFAAHMIGVTEIAKWRKEKARTIFEKCLNYKDEALTKNNFLNEEDICPPPLPYDAVKLELLFAMDSNEYFGKFDNMKDEDISDSEMKYSVEAVSRYAQYAIYLSTLTGYQDIVKIGIKLLKFIENVDHSKNNTFAKCYGLIKAFIYNILDRNENSRNAADNYYSMWSQSIINSIQDKCDDFKSFSNLEQKHFENIFYFFKTEK